MAGETIITVIGNVTDDPELKFTPSGAAVANFTIASTPRTFDRQSNEWKDGDTLFLRCAAWRQLAENVAESLQKGQRVIVTGALKVRQYERQDGSKGTSVEMNVEEVGPSLRYATAKVTRISRSDNGGNGGSNAASSSESNPWGGSQQQPAANPWSTQPAAAQTDAWGGSNDEPPF